MSNKPVVFFVTLLVIALIIVVTFLINTNPFSNVKVTKQGSDKNANVTTDAMALYANNCSRCHGSFGAGMGINPPLQGSGLTIDEIKEVIINGRGAMPPFKNFSQDELLKLSELVRKL
jgi:cytochrome c550